MLPTPEELRKHSKRCRESACTTADLVIKRKLAEHAAVHIAEAIAREGGVLDNKVEGYKQLLAEVLGVCCPPVGRSKSTWFARGCAAGTRDPALEARPSEDSPHLRERPGARAGSTSGS